MSVRELSSMTWEEVRDLDRARALFVLPVGAIEAHGPHLPLGTDVLIADAMARAAAERLARRGWDVLLLPPLAYTAAGFAAGFPGTLPVSADAVARQVRDIVSGLARHGFKLFAIANAHLDPEHLSALHAAVERVAEEDLATVVFPDITRRPWGGRLTDEFRSGACHAGRYETSVVLATRPDLVRDELRAGLEPVAASLSAAIRERKVSFEQAGGPRAYFGDPAAATAEEGRATIETLGAILEEAVLAAERGLQQQGLQSSQ